MARLEKFELDEDQSANKINRDDVQNDKALQFIGGNGQRKREKLGPRVD